MWTLSQYKTLQRVKANAQELNRNDAECHAFTGVVLYYSSFAVDTHIVWRGTKGGESRSLELKTEHSAARGHDVYVLTREAAEEPLEFEHFGDAVEIVEMRIAETAERIGVRL